jgi:hypothetical protein
MQEKGTLFLTEGKRYRLNPVPYTAPDKVPSTMAESFEEFNADFNILSLIKYKWVVKCAISLLRLTCLPRGDLVIKKKLIITKVRLFCKTECTSITGDLKHVFHMK